MFTGIITDIGSLIRVDQGRDARRFRIASRYDPTSIEIGASIAHAGCCLTVIDRGQHEGGGWHDVEVSNESLSITTLGEWSAGMAVNLERAAKFGDEIGGHFVSGHVDDVGEVVSRRSEAGSIRFVFRAPNALAPYIAPKGSIAVDGVSLTVNEVEGAVFGVNIIPHTAEATTLGALAESDRVNLEIDLLARYAVRAAGFGLGDNDE